MYKIKSYINGNGYVHLFEDGTKIREIFGEKYEPRFPESIDINISHKCIHECPYCFISAKKNKKHGNLELLNNIVFDNEYIELSFNINSEIPKDFDASFLFSLPGIKNITINSKSLETHFSFIHKLQRMGAIKGIGISVGKYTDLNFDKINKLENVVFHVINGVHSFNKINKLPSTSKILILGYKLQGRGKYINKKNCLSIKDLNEIIQKFELVSFDSLSLNQLKMKDIVLPDIWNKYYLGDDINHSMYIDIVNKTYSSSSISNKKYKLPGILSSNIHIETLFNNTKNEI